MNLMPCYAGAASTADATEWISPEKSCSLNIYYGYEGRGFYGIGVRLYKIADVSSDFVYTLTESFAASGLILNGVQTNGEWKVIRTTLEAYILSRGVKADATAVTDFGGQASFEGLETGMYMVVADNALQDGYRGYFDTALIALPGLNSDGTWDYDVSAISKGTFVPPSDPGSGDPGNEDVDDLIILKVLKLWRGDEGSNIRPESIEIDIFRNGTLYQTITLSSHNNWAHSWTAEDDGSKWLVSEPNVPQGYVMTVETRGTSFILTNTLEPEDPDDPPDIEFPDTGDTSNILFNTILMYLSGTLLIIFGATRKRKRDEKAN